MRATHQIQPVYLVELERHVLSEHPAGSSEVSAETTSQIQKWGLPLNVLFRVGPDEIGVESFVWNLLETVDRVDSVDGSNKRGETAMNTHDAVINERSNAQIVKNIGEIFPCIYSSVFQKTLIIETIHLSDLSSFVIPTQQCDSVWITRLQAQKQFYGLHTKIPPIDIITHKYIFCIWNITANTKKFH